jgi:hypothetical protein
VGEDVVQVLSDLLDAVRSEFGETSRGALKRIRVSDELRKR